ncbi:GNAT family N-acetyltransferase [Lactobacillus sp. ESL0791]|uniref:GNAT family N-acetyltransferase n=1 Tax=Lactobacillus sp. ESL0791 TaxID=2983234 RepID=UPI0023F9B1FB|nr:GNAT family N-acetyltransferase [Lactobacillus sp. ESL0791]MDF7638712.1 GNAT family N-acetyltransferase [Lactobacillus sp. ESL0791]MDF7638719.1 GNAT family N-acetyltransferase [Lactobacillus sp. ESL0791]
MKIIQTPVLTGAEQHDVKMLMQQIHQHDQTYRDPYLSNQFNYFSEMPAFILAYEGTLLIGLAVIYADEKPHEEVEVFVEVLPERRRQGIAKKLIRLVKKILAEYGYYDIFYLSEQNFLRQSKSFIANNHLVPDPANSAYYLQTTKIPRLAVAASLKRELTVEKIKESEIPEVVAIYKEVFGESRQVATNYVTQEYHDSLTISLVLKKQGKIVGYCSIDLVKDAYFYGLFVAKKYQGRGYGSYFMQKMMELLQAKGITTFALDVELDNQRALHAYQKLGFEIKTKIVYLKEKK